jgi:hypothetical protein
MRTRCHAERSEASAVGGDSNTEAADSMQRQHGSRPLLLNLCHL